MAEKSKPVFSLGDLNTIKEGILAEEAGFKPFKNLFDSDFTLRPATVFGALPGVGGLVNIGQAIGKYQLEDSANKFYGVDKGFKDTSISSGMNDSATNNLIKDIKRFKDNDPYSTTSNITRDDIQSFMMQKKPNLDLAPIQNRMYTKTEIAEGDAGGPYGDLQGYTTQPFTSGRFAQQMTGETDEFGLKGDDFKSAMGSYALSRARDDNLKSVDQFAEDKVYQSNVRNSVDPRTGKDAYNKDFARAVTVESQGDTANADPTFICTALYEMGQMPIGIYKYDQRYGQQVNKKIYNGYAIWGKPIAQKMRSKGYVYSIITPIAIRWAEQMAYDMSDGKVGKRRYSIKAMKFLGEAICYGIGLFIKPEGEKHGSNRNRQHGEERRTIRGEDGLLKKRGRPRTKRRTAS